MADTSGHGTHVAGIAGADVVGVANSANLISVKTLGGSSSDTRYSQAWRDVIAVHNNKKANAAHYGFMGSVINMSFNSTIDLPTVRKAISEAAAAGISMFATSGNTGEDLFKLRVPYEPCTLPNVYCVGAVTNRYTKAGFSNFG